MTLLDRYVSRSVLLGTLIATFVLMTLFVFMFFVAELQYVRGNYTALKVAEYSILANMRVLRELFPMLALVGSLLGLGMLANSNELTVMRAAGISVGRITWSVMKIGFWMMLFMVLFSELVVPVSEQYGKQMRAMALNQKVFVGGKAGLWMRDGNSYVNARTVKSSDRLENVRIYSLDEGGKMVSSLHASYAQFEVDQWMLYRVKETRFSEQGLTVERKKKVIWPSSLEPQIVDVVSIAPIDLSLPELVKIISHLKLNELNVQRHEVAFWSKIFLPISTAVMVFLAVPFVFGSLRSVAISQRLLNGILIGIMFFLMNEGVTRMGVVYEFPAFLSAATPTFIVALFAWYLFRRIR
ncbi:MAG: LPS export ABC transporter permease LptG [Gammaproteobacteria bacterium]|nr:LPS export ABC transporter permease LptG [Gammaproteobacteria bacterium]